MASNINPNNIDGAYPVAGQDNDSQGFRDNFTNTKTNFQYAAGEITDLQSKAVLKSALTGTVLNNNMNNSVISNVQLLNASAPIENLLTVSGAVTLNFATSPYKTFTLGGATTIGFSNWPNGFQVATMRVQVIVTDITYTLGLPAEVTIGTANIQGLASNILTFNETGVFEFEFETYNNGITVTIFDLTRNHDPIYLPSSENLAFVANVANVSLDVTASYFTTNAAATGSLVDGIEGQIKTLMAANVAAGNYVLSVANAAWGGANTITFNSQADACIMQYINGQWYVVGNNGCSIA
jgi:hypothetical protein